MFNCADPVALFSERPMSISEILSSYFSHALVDWRCPNCSVALTIQQTKTIKKTNNHILVPAGSSLSATAGCGTQRQRSPRRPRHSRAVAGTTYLRRQHPHLSRSFLTSNVDLQELARHRTLVNSSQLTGAFDQSKRERSSKLS
jgi:hypothetical protein